MKKAKDTAKPVPPSLRTGKHRSGNDRCYVQEKNNTVLLEYARGLMGEAKILGVPSLDGIVCFLSPFVLVMLYTDIALYLMFTPFTLFSLFIFLTLLLMFIQ